MKNKNVSIFGVVFFLVGIAVSPSTWASTTTPLINYDNYSVGMGDLETSFLFNAQLFRGDFNSDLFQFEFGGNYFMDDFFAPGVEFSVQDSLGTFVKLLPNLKYYFNQNGRVLPYAQLAAGIAHYPGMTGFDLGIGAGVNYLLSSTVGIGIKFRYDLVLGGDVIHEIQFPIQFALYFKL